MPPIDDTPEEFKNVTRVHVVPSPTTGHKEYWADSWRFSLQDDGRTLKIFGTGSGGLAEATRNRELALDMSRDLSKITQEFRDARSTERDQ